MAKKLLFIGMAVIMELGIRQRHRKRFLKVYLKKHGKKQASDAVKHFNTLEFVGVAEAIGVIKHMNII